MKSNISQSTFFNNSHFLKFSDILQKNTGKLFEKEYIIPGKFDLYNIVNDFHYVKSIKIQPFDNIHQIDKLCHNNYISIENGIEKYYERENKNIILCKHNDDFNIYDIDFITPAFTKYNEHILTLKTNGAIGNLYKIIIKGLQITSINNKDANLMIEYDHDSKYYQIYRK